MRTTVDLPDDLHELARQLAHQQNITLSEVVTRLIRLGLEPASRPGSEPADGLPRLSIGRIVTAEDVRSLDDEQ